MSPARFLPKRDYFGLKAATRNLVVRNGGGNEAAVQTRVGQQALDRYGSTSCEHADRFSPIDVIADLEAACGDPVVTRKLAELSGHVLVPVPVASRCDSVIDIVTAKAVATLGNLLTEIAEAKADGKITGEEAAALKPMVADLVVKFLRLDLQLDAVIETERDAS